MFKLGLIINPIAGMGGRVGLKGTDGPEVLAEAKKRGAEPGASIKAEVSLSRLTSVRDDLEVITCPGIMGEMAVCNTGLNFRLIKGNAVRETTFEDTIHACREFLKEKVELIVFAGGDGTARDVFRETSDSVPVVGIPAGVKIHSAVFAVNPIRAGDLILSCIKGSIKEYRDAEVMDIDEDLYRSGRIMAKLFGYMKIPFEKNYLQGLKSGSPVSEKYAQEAIASDIIENMVENCCYLIGPGTTTKAIMDKLGLHNTLLGIDAVFNKKTAGNDLNEEQILGLINGEKAMIIITPIGGQAYLFGRGNQQISSRVIKIAGDDNIIIAATSDKITSLKGKPFYVDTGDRKLDNQLKGFIPVITGFRQRIVYKVEC